MIGGRCIAVIELGLLKEGQFSIFANLAEEILGLVGNGLFWWGLLMLSSWIWIWDLRFSLKDKGFIIEEVEICEIWRIEELTSAIDMNNILFKMVTIFSRLCRNYDISVAFSVIIYVFMIHNLSYNWVWF